MEGMRKTIGCLVIGALLAAVSVVPGHARDPAPSDTPRIYAYYYLWWSDQHWKDKLGPNYPYERRPLPLPAKLGEGGCNARSKFEGNQLFDVPKRLLSQDQPGVIERDVRNAAAAGLGGFLVNWRGTGEPDQAPADISYSRRLASTIDAVNEINSEGIDFKLWLNYKASSDQRETSEIVNDLAYIQERYGHNGAWDHHYSDRIMLVWGGSRKYSTETIQLISARFRSTFFFVGDENRDSWDDERGAALDGNQYYWSSQNPYTNPESFDQLQELSNTVRNSGQNLDGSNKLWFAPLTPGYNSQLLRGGSCVPRHDGKTIRALFDGNSASQPDGWVLISWNEIAEGTYVRPLRRWGDRYLDILRDLTTSN